MYDEWKQGGVHGDPCCTKRCCRGGMRFNRTKHGWMDGLTMCDWLTTIVVPHRLQHPGKFVVCGDNLSSHLDTRAIEICKQYDITFVCLPPNSTHITQCNLLLPKICSFYSDSLHMSLTYSFSNDFTPLPDSSITSHLFCV